MGDVHPLGNPHFSLDPGLGPIITQNIVDGLSRLWADDRPAFERSRQAFLERLAREMERWNKILEPVRGAKVVAYHPDVIYFLTRFGLVQVGTLEDRPGIPPSPQHLVQIIRQMKADRKSTRLNSSHLVISYAVFCLKKKKKKITKILATSINIRMTSI